MRSSPHQLASHHVNGTAAIAIEKVVTDDQGGRVEPRLREMHSQPPGVVLIEEESEVLRRTGAPHGARPLVAA